VAELPRIRRRWLSERESTRCEDAKWPGCQCRCGGVFHGATRGKVRDLPPTDPHYIRRNQKRMED